jgi:hypothetical protein
MPKKYIINPKGLNPGLPGLVLRTTSFSCKSPSYQKVRVPDNRKLIQI